ncbi:MAG: VanZ family protein [Prevotella sp.]|nr:VanZ family protein [Prevotella sp.]
MNYLKHLITCYPFTSMLIVVIFFLCLWPIIPETPLNHVALIDKWTHMVMYGGTFGIMWIEYLYKHTTHNTTKIVCLGFIAPILMGGLIEILQANCTGGRRSGEWMDFYADAIGVVLAAIFGILLGWYRAKGKKET